MTAILLTAPVFALECGHLKCLVQYRAIAPAGSRSEKAIRAEAAQYGWQVRPASGPGSRTGEDRCPDHRNDGNGIAYTFVWAPKSAELFNQMYPQGTMVRAYPGVRGERERHVIGKTRSQAWKVGSGSPVVMVEGLSGGIALTHIDIALAPDNTTVQKGHSA